ncbi:MAG: ABC-2 family transporter protein [Caldilineaceae bacterium]|nr:ABC-2 family transporter protein [Caldilineaceae bacterium]
MGRQLAFVLALWKTNLLSAMEYRVSFLTQVFGMMLNNAIYFVFWIIFFTRFEEINGWDLVDMLFLFGVVATGFGAGTYLFGNAVQLSSLIANGQMDYYLSLPRPVLLHALASSSNASSAGDFTYGLFSFGAAIYFSGSFGGLMLLRFTLGCLASIVVLISFLVLVQSLTFWIGNTSLLTRHAFNAIVTFSLYPITLFDGTAKLLLFTLIPAAFIGALPAEFVRSFDPLQLAQICAGGAVFLLLSVFVFYRGLRRYESGSAIQVRM